MAKRITIQIDEEGRDRVEEVAAHFSLTQAGAASLLVRAATDARIAELVIETARRLGHDRPGSAGPVDGETETRSD